jgi:site-specific DNA-methyltransferase (adenine-specific)
MTPESIDAVVTEPPFLPPDDYDFLIRWWIGNRGHPIWKRCFAALKPGGHVAAIAGQSTMDMISMAIRLSGFEIRDAIGYVRAGPAGAPPDWCPIIIARKPLAGTVAETVLAHGTGALNIDACRIKTEGEVLTVALGDPSKRKGLVGTDLGITRASKEKFQAAQIASIEKANRLGRWPANVIHDGTPEVEDAFGAFGERSSKPFVANRTNKADLQMQFMVSQDYAPAGGYADSGNVARFFFAGTMEEVRAWLTTMLVAPGGVVMDPYAR